MSTAANSASVSVGAGSPSTPGRPLAWVPESEGRPWWYRAFFAVFIFDTVVNLKLRPPFGTDAFLAPLVFVFAKSFVLLLVFSALEWITKSKPRDYVFAGYAVWFLSSLTWAVVYCLRGWSAYFTEKGDLITLLLRHVKELNSATCTLWSGTTYADDNGCPPGLTYFAFYVSMLITTVIGTILYLAIARWFRLRPSQHPLKDLAKWAGIALCYVLVNAVHAYVIRF
jgi:hypothetical protein